MLNMSKKTGPRTFVHVGKYEGRNKRTHSTFRVVHGLELEQLKKIIQEAVNKALS